MRRGRPTTHPAWGPRRAVAAAVLGAVLLGAPVRAQDDRVALMHRVADYIASFEKQFGAMVAEEKYVQFVAAMAGTRSLPTGPQQTVLRSDFLLVNVASQGWVPFRDVFERDGKAVRDRQDRLSSLFLGDTRNAIEQARRISDESARYNIGNIQRNINVPTLALVYLAGDYQSRMEFTDGKTEDAGRIVNFKEVARPTFIHTAEDRDLPAAGRAWIDPQTGAVHKTEVNVYDSTVEAHITVTYQVDDATKIWVPAKMEERYKRPRDNFELRGLATYSRFRRFSVSTSQDIADPK